MPAFTARISLYMPGGGSLSIGGDDEVADIDRINENMQKLDSSIGAPQVELFPADPFPGQIVSTGSDAYFWNDAAAKWLQLNPHVGKTAPASPQEGYLWVDTN